MKQHSFALCAAALGQAFQPMWPKAVWYYGPVMQIRMRLADEQD